MPEKSPQPLPDSIVLAHIILVNEVFGGFQSDRRVARKLHPGSWRELYRPSYALDQKKLLVDAQKSTLFVDQVQNALDKLTAVEHQVVTTRLGLENNGIISTFKDSGANAEQYLGRRISRERARRIYIAALRRLSLPSITDKLPTYLPAQHPWVRRNIRWCAE